MPIPRISYPEHRGWQSGQQYQRGVDCLAGTGLKFTKQKSSLSVTDGPMSGTPRRGRPLRTGEKCFGQVLCLEIAGRGTGPQTICGVTDGFREIQTENVFFQVFLRKP